MLRRSTLSQLKSVSIQFAFYGDPFDRRRPDDAAKGSICHLIANAPALESLDIGSTASHWEGTRSFDLDALFIHLQRRPTFQSSLRSIGCGVLKLPVPQAKGFLASLSCLEPANDCTEDEVVWHALRASDIKLATIKVKKLTSQLIDYIHAYHGLRNFHMDVCHGYDGYYVSDEILRSLLTSALTAHCATLVDLRFYPSPLNHVERMDAERQPKICYGIFRASLFYYSPSLNFGVWNWCTTGSPCLTSRRKRPL